MIDFTTIFAKHEIECLDFRTGADRMVNYFHDIIFLSSYLHDATFSPKAMVHEDGKLTLDIHRDCWEFYTRIHRLTDKLLGCRSKLQISGVASANWSTDAVPEEFEITKVYVGERQYLDGETARLIIASLGQDLRFELIGSDDFFEIELKDLEEPH